MKKEWELTRLLEEIETMNEFSLLEYEAFFAGTGDETELVGNIAFFFNGAHLVSLSREDIIRQSEEPAHVTLTRHFSLTLDSDLFALRKSQDKLAELEFAMQLKRARQERLGKRPAVAKKQIKQLAHDVESLEKKIETEQGNLERILSMSAYARFFLAFQNWSSRKELARDEAERTSK